MLIAIYNKIKKYGDIAEFHTDGIKQLDLPNPKPMTCEFD